jgi:hypothetical protein
MGEGTDAARREVLAARAALGDEVVRLEAAGRAAIDIPAKVRRSPAKALGTAAGAAFLLGGGPKRLFRGIRRAVRGPAADLPPSLLPKEVDAALRKLGPDGDRVRGTLEREFTAYLDAHAPERQKRDLGATTTTLLANLFGPLTARAGKQLAEQLLDPDSETFARVLEELRKRPRPPRAPGHGPS